MRGGVLEGQPVADRHIARVIHRLSQENSEPLFDAGRLKNEFCVSRQNQLAASHRCSCGADWSLILLARITGIRSPECVREPGPQRVKTLNVVHRKGARAARAGQHNKSERPAGVADHGVE
jgi:hypothetical protein